MLTIDAWTDDELGHCRLDQVGKIALDERDRSCIQSRRIPPSLSLSGWYRSSENRPALDPFAALAKRMRAKGNYPETQLMTRVLNTGESTISAESRAEYAARHVG